MIIPLKRENPLKSTPWFLYIIILMNCLVCAVVFIGEAGDHFSDTVEFLGFIPANPTLLQAISSTFLHIDAKHLFLNMYFLWMFGENVEDVLGSGIFLIVFFLCAFCGDLIEYFLFPQSIIPRIGASGAISGVIGVFLIFFYKMEVQLEIIIFKRWTPIKTTALKLGIFWFILQLSFGLLSLSSSDPIFYSVAFWAHIGGFLSGLLFGVMAILLGFKKRYDIKPLDEKRAEAHKRFIERLDAMGKKKTEINQ